MNTAERILEAFKGKKIEELDESHLCDRILEIVMDIFIICGFSVPPTQDAVIIVSRFIQFLKEKFAYLYLGEIDVCFDLGSQGRFGEIYKISLKTLVDWIQGYKSCAERLEALAVRQQELESCKQKRRTEFENSDVYERDTLEKIFGSYVIGRFLLNPVVPGIFVSLLKRHILAKSDFERTGVEPTVTENDTEKSDVKKLRMVVINCFNRLIDSGNPLKLLTAEERIKYGL